MSSSARAWPLVMRREIVVKLTDRTFLVSTALTLLLIGGILVAQAVLRDHPRDYSLAATPSARTMADTVAERAPELNSALTVTVTSVADEAGAREAVESGSATAWLHEEGTGWVLTTRDQVPLLLQTATSQVVHDVVLARNAATAGTTVTALEAGSGLRTDRLNGAAQNAGLTSLLGFAFAFLFYLASLLFGIQLAGSVVEEKQSRIIEIIATSIPIRQLLAGKILGNTLLAFAQLAIYLGVGLLGVGSTAYAGLLPSVSGAVVWFLAFFLTGFIALASLWAVAGALASRHEDLQSTTPPLTMLVMAMFFGGLFLGGTWQTVLSFVPPVSAVLMPVRVLGGGVAWWEPVTALLLLSAFAAVTLVIGERIYRRALLRGKGRVSLRQAWAAEE